MPHDVVGMLMPPILRLFRQDHPNVLVTLVSDTSRTLKRSLVEGEVDLTLLTEPQPGEGDRLLLSDRLVWVGAKGGDAHKRDPLPIALGQESCGFRAAAVQALTRARREWKAICQVGSLEPVFATLEADMAIAPFLSKTVPERLAVLTGSAFAKAAKTVRQHEATLDPRQRAHEGTGAVHPRGLSQASWLTAGARGRRPCFIPRIRRPLPG